MKKKRLNVSQDYRRFSRLSKLQKWILVAANQNRKAKVFHGLENRGVTADLKYFEIKERFYGFPRKKRWGSPVERFTKSDIPEYASASAAITRAVSRLERRGLVTAVRAVNSWWAAVALTELGIVAAKAQIEKTA